MIQYTPKEAKMRNTVEPILIQKLGVSGKVKDTHFGVLINGKPNILPNIDNMDELIQRIKQQGWTLIKNES
jgi:predicted phage-related endonuclease